MAKAVKMKDIAEKLNISTMTVSKALSGKPGVSDSMREKIKNLALEMGYVFPGESTDEVKKSYNIGVILANYYTEKCATFYWKLYQEINTKAVERDCFVMLEIISDEEEGSLMVPKLIRENKVDGLLVLGCMDNQYLQMLIEKIHVPVVFIDFYTKNYNSKILLFSNWLTADMAIGQGIQKIVDYARSRKVVYIHILGAGWNISDVKQWHSVNGVSSCDSIAYYTAGCEQRFGSKDPAENARRIIYEISKNYSD